MAVWLVLMIGLAGLMVNLFRLQILQGDRLRALARNQQQVTVKSFTPRHTIEDRNGTVLAIDQSVYDIYAHPTHFTKNHDEIAAELAPILEQPVGDLLYAFSQSESGIRLASRVDEAIAEDIRELGLDGIDLDAQQQRYYPYANVFSHVIGYVNVDQEGQVGVESEYQDRLVGRQESFDLLRTGQGDILPESLPSDRIQRDDLTLRLTLDSQLQQMVHQRLMSQLAQYSTDRGVVMVMDVNDGAILAMAVEPSFNPNRYFAEDQARFRNWAVSDAMEPGSTFKPVNLAIALDEELTYPGEVFYDGGYIYVGSWLIKNSDFDDYGGHGQVTVADILKLSSNVGMIQIMQRLRPAAYYRWLERVGVERRSGIDLPVDGAGALKNFDDFTRGKVEAATASFGQGFSVTPIQLLQMQAAIANGGRLITPHVAQGLFGSDGQPHWTPQFPTTRRLFDADAARQVLDMMELVVEDGTGKTAQIPGYRIAGKTGTAQKASAQGGYDASAKVTSFVSIFPVDAPRYVVLAIIDEPKGENLFGSTVATPVVKSVMEFMIAREVIPVRTESDAQPEFFDVAPEVSSSSPLIPGQDTHSSGR